MAAGRVSKMSGALVWSELIPRSRGADGNRLLGGVLTAVGKESYPSGEILFSEHREGRIHLNYADHKESDAKQDLCSGKCCTFAAVISRGMLGCSGNVAGMFTFSSVTLFLVVVVFNVCFSETSSPTSAW